MSIFQTRQTVKIKQSFHNLSHNCSGSFYPGLIYPIMCTKVVPGDVFQIASNPDLRMQPSVAPFFTNVRCDVRYFYCRNLLLWKNFDEYITGHERYSQGNNTLHTVHPAIDVDGQNGSLQDYIYGCIDEATTYKDIDPLPFRMYNMIYNEYYRDENVGTSAKVVLDDTGDQMKDYILRNACYRRDYFTSSLPFTQAGDPVVLPANVLLKSTSNRQLLVDGSGDPLRKFSSGQVSALHSTEDVPGGLNKTTLGVDVTPSGGAAFTQYGWLDPNGTYGVNIDIREFRNANAIQRFLERSAVNGNRYAEYMLAHFGVKTPDNSSYRPQYLGGGEQLINVSPVEQNAPSAYAPTGTLAGRGRLNGVVGMNHKYLFTEYGWVMALMVIRPDADYVGGVNRQFFADGDRYDLYYNPAFQNIGMQEVNVREIAYPSLNGVSPYYDPKEVFSYSERYMEYKTIPNHTHGNLAGNQGNMKPWVVTRDFSRLTAAPKFNPEFVEVQTDCLDNNMAVQNFAPYFGTIHHEFYARRPMQYRAKYKV